MESVADWLKPIYQVMRDEMFTAHCVNVDEWSGAT